MNPPTIDASKGIPFSEIALFAILEKGNEGMRILSRNPPITLPHFHKNLVDSLKELKKAGHEKFMEEE